MEKKFDDKELKALFQASKKEMDNGYFSVHVMRNLPEKQNSFAWVYALIFSIFSLIIGFSINWNKWAETILPNNPLVYCGLFLGFLCGFFLIIKHEQSKNYLF
ncbi:hypothetical protein FACS189413_07700 [Bacteroidia bacterium]|nr:hypothetical protein FACS189413_07700 [Bacteroidia bacterium]